MASTSHIWFLNKITNTASSLLSRLHVSNIKRKRNPNIFMVNIKRFNTKLVSKLCQNRNKQENTLTYTKKEKGRNKIG